MSRKNIGRKGRLRGLFRDTRAQAMVEYALISLMILLGWAVTSQFVLPMFLNAYQAYYDQFYFMLNLPVP